MSPIQSRRQTLTPELARLNRDIEQYARSYGLDFYETIFEVLDFEEMNMVAAYGGFPNRYPHWKFGRNTSASTRATPTACTRFTKWSLIMTRATRTCWNATTLSIRRSSWRMFTGIVISSRTTFGSRRPTAK